MKGSLTKKGRVFRDDVINIVRSRSLIARSQSLLVGFTSSVRVDLYFFPPDRRVRDNSNHTKVLYDALTKAGFWADDSLIKSETYHSGNVVKGGSVVLFCEEVDYLLWDFDQVRESLGVEKIS